MPEPANTSRHRPLYAIKIRISVLVPLTVQVYPKNHGVARLIHFYPTGEIHAIFLESSVDLRQQGAFLEVIDVEMMGPARAIPILVNDQSLTTLSTLAAARMAFNRLKLSGILMIEKVIIRLKWSGLLKLSD